MKKAKFYIGITLVAIVVLSIVRVVVTNTIVTSGIDLGKMQSRIKVLKKENTLLHQKVLELSSLHYIASQAGELGFVNSKNEIVISSPLPIALNQ